MEILLVSQCDHKALKETRRILDQFACRTGDRCWQTPMTMNGLKTLHKMLRATARKNTAVACHRIGGRGGAELFWIVGDRSRFDEAGHVPTQSTNLDILRHKDENNWDSQEAVQRMAYMAGLLHDLGKASKAFQQKLLGKNSQANILRHEYQSARMVAHFVKESGEGDEAWLRRLTKGEGTDLNNWLPDWGENFKAEKEIRFFEHLPPLAKAIIWLIFSHHRLPVSPDSEYYGKPATGIKIDLLKDPLLKVKADWNNRPALSEEDIKKEYKNYSKFEALETVLQTPAFEKKLKYGAQALLKFQEKHPDWQDWQSDLYMLHLTRLSLMLADHHVSSWPYGKNKRIDYKDGQAAANTYKTKEDKEKSKSEPKQSLAGHLIEVAQKAQEIGRYLENFSRPLTGISNVKIFRKRSPSAFNWQNKAYDEALGLQDKTAENGAFIVNLASTGCGKTLGNAKIMAGLTPEKENLRFSYALGLRVLTRQTGEAYEKYLNLTKEELGIFVGGAVSQEITDFLEEKAAETGSESEGELLPDILGTLIGGEEEENTHIDTEDALFFKQMAEIDSDLGERVSLDRDWETHPILLALYGHGQESGKHENKKRFFLDAPVLVCTVDHLVPATEAWRGGGQINPMLRLMSSDLILDELDDYSLEDMPALTRLVWYCGMLGRKVLLSSATLPEALVTGMFLAYRAGRKIYLKNHGGYSGSRSYEEPEIPCLWVDEFQSKGCTCKDGKSFEEAHQKFAKERGDKLLKAAENSPLRQGKIIGQDVLKENISEEMIHSELGKLFQKEALNLHKAHGETILDGAFKGKKVSFGLIRMANISPLYRVAQAFFALDCPEKDTRIHLCVYHSRFPLICRSAIEAGLDGVFNRKKGAKQPWERKIVQEALEKGGKDIQNHVFIVLASPVCEVGRDWDADWAIAEPSSVRSIIQLAGRVRRHRKPPQKPPPEKPNILLLNRNVKAMKGNTIAYEKPGFEGDKKWALNSHDLETLLRKSEYETITSIPRLLIPEARLKEETADRKTKLGDLELCRTSATMKAKPKTWQNPDGKVMGRRDAVICWWEDFSKTSLTGLLPQNQPFREQAGKEVDLAFIWNEGKERIELEQALQKNKQLYTEIMWAKEAAQLSFGKNVSFWNKADLETLLKEWLGKFNGETEESRKAEAERVTTFSAYALKEGEKWQWHDVLGLDFIKSNK